MVILLLFFGEIYIHRTFQQAINESSFLLITTNTVCSQMRFCLFVYFFFKRCSFSLLWDMSYCHLDLNLTDNKWWLGLSHVPIGDSAIKLLQKSVCSFLLLLLSDMFLLLCWYLKVLRLSRIIKGLSILYLICWMQICSLIHLGVFHLIYNLMKSHLLILFCCFCH